MSGRRHSRALGEPQSRRSSPSILLHRRISRFVMKMIMTPGVENYDEGKLHMLRSLLPFRLSLRNVYANPLGLVTSAFMTYLHLRGDCFLPNPQIMLNEMILKNIFLGDQAQSSRKPMSTQYFDSQDLTAVRRPVALQDSES